MKKLIMIVILAAGMVSSASSQTIFVGLRDNHYVRVGFEEKHGFEAMVEHTVFSTKFKLQSVNVRLGYSHTWNRLEADADLYGGIQYKNDYKRLGAVGSLTYIPLSCLKLKGAVMYNYDTFYKSDVCFSVAASLRFFKSACLETEYTDMPEFRQCEKRVNCGLRFEGGDLWVHPYLSIPLDNTRNYMRLLVGFGYSFHI